MRIWINIRGKMSDKNHPWHGKDVFEETVKLVFPKEGQIIEEWGSEGIRFANASYNINEDKIEKSNDNDTPKD